METRKECMRGTALALILIGGAFSIPAFGADKAPARPEGSCDIYAAAGTPCVAAHSTTRALYAGYNGPLYQVMRLSDGKKLDISVVQASANDGGGYADAAAQDAFCADTHCVISVIYDQSGHHNDLSQAPRGGFSGPSLGGFNNLPVADMAPITVMGHKAYGVFIAPGMGLRNNDPVGTAVDDQAEGMYWVIDGEHFNNGCCFDYGNGEIDSRDDGNGTMETLYFGNSTGWIHGVLPGPWIMTDQENNLVGCVNDDKSKLCPNLPAVQWRFATAMAKGKPHHWAMLVGDADKPNSLKVTYEGRRVDGTYDPMRKQGAILLGNGGDNSNGSHGTFYEGAMTAAGTYPTDATDKAVHANIAAAGYDLPMVTLIPEGQTGKKTTLITYPLHTRRAVTLTFTNRTGQTLKNVKFRVIVPEGWKGRLTRRPPTDTVSPGMEAKTSFLITTGRKAFNGDIKAEVSWGEGKSARTETAVLKVRCTKAVKINEFRISDGTKNPNNSFIELYNASDKATSISGWSLTIHAGGKPVFSTITIPRNTTLIPHGYYTLGLAGSGLTVAAAKGKKHIYVRQTAGLKKGQTITIGSGDTKERVTIRDLGSASAPATEVWQPAEAPMWTLPVGSTNVPVTSVAGFKVGEKIALGYGTTYPVTGRDTEKYEIATVTEIGKPGTQAYLEAAAPAGSSVLQTEGVANISAGDKIRLDIASKGHGIETVTVKSVGTAAQRGYVAAPAKVGATSIMAGATRDWWGGYKLSFSKGAKLDIGTPGNLQQVTITGAHTLGKQVRVSFTPALKEDHINGEFIVIPGTGIELTAPLKFDHAANLPFSDRGTGISFTPKTQKPHGVNEPVVALGRGIQLEAPLEKDHEINAVIRNARFGYKDKHVTPDLWFGGPVLSVNSGSMVLRTASGVVADSVNYGNYANNGNLIDPWAGEGDQATNRNGLGGCFVITPGSPVHFPQLTGITGNASAGRFPDGQDTDSNCNDFHASVTSEVKVRTKIGTRQLKVDSVAGFRGGYYVMIGSGKMQERAMIAAVGSAGVTELSRTAHAGMRILGVRDDRPFRPGQKIVIGLGDEAETAEIAMTGFNRGPEIILKTALKHDHPAQDILSGTGIILDRGLKHSHPKDTPLVSYPATPGRTNVYAKNEE